MHDVAADCERAIREVAKGVLSDGRATLTRLHSVHGDWFELTPVHPAASPMIGQLVLVDGPWVFRQTTFARWPPQRGRWQQATYDPY